MRDRLESAAEVARTVFCIIMVIGVLIWGVSMVIYVNKINEKARKHNERIDRENTLRR